MATGAEQTWLKVADKALSGANIKLCPPWESLGGPVSGDAGAVSPEGLPGSWAGTQGHCCCAWGSPPPWQCQTCVQWAAGPTVAGRSQPPTLGVVHELQAHAGTWPEMQETQWMDAAAFPWCWGSLGLLVGGQQDALSRAPQTGASWGKSALSAACADGLGLGVHGKGRARATNSRVTSPWSAGLSSPAASQPSGMGKSQPPPCAHREKGTISAAAAPGPQEQG